MPRLFVAIDLPENIQHQLIDISVGVPGAKWVDSEQLHLTLRFIGEVDGTVADDIADQLTTIEIPPFSLALSGVGHFPARGEPRLLWAGLTPNAGLTRLRNQIENVVVELGVKAEKRKFAPHVTLGRLHDTPAERVASFLAEHTALSSPPFNVEEFHLYSSQLTQKSAVHTKEYTYPLVEKSKLSFREKWQRGLI